MGGNGSPLSADSARSAVAPPWCPPLLPALSTSPRTHYALGTWEQLLNTTFTATQ